MTTTGYLKKWTPFDFACRLRSLQQGALNVGNTQQNKTNLQNLAIAEANAAANWAKWNVTRAAGTQPRSLLMIWVQKVPGYVSPAGTND